MKLTMELYEVRSKGKEDVRLNLKFKHKHCTTIIDTR